MPGGPVFPGRAEHRMQSVRIGRLLPWPDDVRQDIIRRMRQHKLRHRGRRQLDIIRRRHLVRQLCRVL